MEETTPYDLTAMRPPLTDASNRINNCVTPVTESVAREDYILDSPDAMSIDSPVSSRNKGENNRPLSVADARASSKRNSSMSAASIASGKGKRKTHVGPWQLGRTLGSGATGRVRLAKHAATGQTAAIKIVSKKCAAISQSDSIAAMDKNAGNFIGSGIRQMPSGIEREVVIMKLIEHPNVISLYDVWENRGELYLVLEYVEGGELFDYVSNHGPLPEEEAVRLFRQIIAGLGYCHRFNICHRDLKPENILLDSDHNVKLADFGMAALQPAGHWLNTSCGSPHYAAPEIIYGRKYRGDRADIWSCGIILYALLTGFLPFDGGDLHSTLQLVRKGDYMIPPNVSDEAADLIQRILQKKPDDRISMREMWKHPLLKKYEKFHQAICNHYLGPPPPLSAEDCGPPVVRQGIDVDILRNLQTLWHDVKPEQLIERLLSLEPTQERMFYHALVRFRNEQLENYQGQPLRYSTSDYHHISRGQVRLSRILQNRSQDGSRRWSQAPAVKETGKRKLSTREPISSGTVESYDPFRSPYNRGPEKSPQHAPVTIRRDPVASLGKAQLEITQPSNSTFDDSKEKTDNSHSAPFTIVKKKRSKVNSIKSLQSKSSLSGSRRPINSASTPRSASYKRNVCFRHNRNRSQSSVSVKAKRPQPGPRRQPSEGSIISVYDDDTLSGRQDSPVLPAQPAVVRGAEIAIKSSAQRKVQHSDFIWKEDARKVSHELSQICEEAFNGSSLSTARTDSTCIGSETPATSVSIASPTSNHQVDGSSSTVCITPQTPGASPGPSNASKELQETRRKLIEHSTRDGSKDLPGYLATVISHLDRLIDQEKSKQADNKIKNDEHCSSISDLFPKPPEPQLPIISEELNATPARADDGSSDRVGKRASGSTATSSNRGDIRRGKRSIRMVPQSSFQSIDLPESLAINKTRIDTEKNSEMLDSDKSSVPGSRVVSCRPACELDPIDEHPSSPRRSALRNTEPKKWSWFRRSQNIEEIAMNVPRVVRPLHPSSATVIVHEVDSKPTTETPGSKEDQPKLRKASGDSQRSSFWKFMKRKTSKIHGPEQTTTNPLLDNQHAIPKKASTPPPPPPPPSKHTHRFPRPQGKSNNWLARVFAFKPATRVVALNTTKIKGRKEIYKMLRDWKQYGIEDIYLDKANSIIYGRVGESNLLRLRPVEFSADFYTVIEDGQQANLSLVRFRQERGAASSFNKVVDTLCLVMKQRQLLVEDPVRAKKIAMVLDAFPDT
ncbi:hypothetical protein BJX61DRAFT_279792 [Aspergillus egyptiacus]|nr:hypothetical protein BJX61DRAFT_279792 [Aspergillus egyptiacus]